MRETTTASRFLAKAALLVLAIGWLQATNPAFADQSPSTPAARQTGAPSVARAAGGPLPKHEVGSAPGLSLAYFDAAGLSSEVRQAMEREVEALFGEIGVAIQTIDGSALASGNAAPNGVLLRVNLMARNPSAWGLHPEAMGVLIGKQTPPEAVFIFQPVIYRVLELTTKGEHYLSPEEIGRAFGRIVAHEVVHAFAPDHPHRAWGVMGHNQDVSTLTQPSQRIDKSSAKDFVQGLERVSEITERRAGDD